MTLNTRLVRPIDTALVHGGSLILTGSGFGAKAVAAPHTYDDFQSVALGSAILGDGKWADDDGNPAPVASNAQLRSGTPFTRNMRCHWNQDAGGMSCVVQQIGASATNDYFMDAWFYPSLDGGTWLSGWNFKPAQLQTPSPPWTRSYVGFMPDPDSSDCGVAGQNDGGPDSGGNDPYWGQWFGSTNGIVPEGGEAGFPSSAFFGSWIHYQYLVKGGTPGDYDGSLVIYINSILRVKRLGNIGRLNAADSGVWDKMDLGGYVREDPHDPFSIFWENVYLDNSWARVEIGNAATYGACTHREIQIPTAWSDTSVTVTLNRGSFPDFTGLYAFVIDSDNVVQLSQAL